MRLSSVLVSFSFFLINFLLPFVEGTSRGNGNSAVSFTLCDDFTWEQGRHFSLQVASKTDPNALTARFGQGDSLTKFLSRNIQQNDVSFVKYESDLEICFQSLVVDTTIIIDQPTFFKESCEEDGENTALCQQKGSEVQPVSVCPEALTKLLQESGFLRSMPTEKPGPNDFTPPLYDITDDMAHASQEIADGTAELFRKVVKRKVQKLNEVRRIQFSDIGRKLKTFNSFMGAFGPMFSIFSGITSIITTFLTPNPFDELANYLNSEFREIHRRLSHIQNDIADLKRVVQRESKMCGMAGKLEAIRYSFRRYERMVKKLSEDKVCGADNLYNRTEVRDFMEQYKEDRVDDSLLDMFGVEFAEVLEASSLLKAMMRAYCTTDPGKVQRFMEGIIKYALAGSLSHFAYTSLRCHKEARQDCDENQDEWEEWNRKLYEFLKKANALKEAATNPGYGLQLDIQEDLAKLIND